MVTATWVICFWIAPTRSPTSLAAVALCSASRLTSPATTAKPRPCFPARAASIAAFSASRLVWSAISRMRPMKSVMRRVTVTSERTCSELSPTKPLNSTSRCTAPPMVARLPVAVSLASLLRSAASRPR